MNKDELKKNSYIYNVKKSEIIKLLVENGYALLMNTDRNGNIVPPIQRLFNKEDGTYWYLVRCKKVVEDESLNEVMKSISFPFKSLMDLGFGYYNPSNKLLSFNDYYVNAILEDYFDENLNNKFIEFMFDKYGDEYKKDYKKFFKTQSKNEIEK